MNETNSPLPPSGGAICPNCGATQNAGAPYCTSCGAELRPATPGPYSQSSKIIVSIALGFGALLFGAIGGCFALLGGGGFELAFAPFIIVPALAAIGCIWGIFRVLRK